MKVGILGGGGSFAREFIPLFAAHPLVSEVVLAEVLPDRRREIADRFGIRRAVGSMEELLTLDVDAVAIFTQRWMHAPQATAALRAGKHVYSAVPAAISIPELAELVATVESTGLTYMMGETSHYYPAACTVGSALRPATSDGSSTPKVSTYTTCRTASTTRTATPVELIGKARPASHRCSTDPTRWASSYRSRVAR